MSNKCFQDWDNITITNVKPKPKPKAVAPKIKYDEDGQEIVKVNKVDDKTKYIKMREQLNLSRSELAQKLSLKSNDINNIESGNICSSDISNKYKNYLSMQVKKMNNNIVKKPNGNKSNDSKIKPEYDEQIAIKESSNEEVNLGMQNHLSTDLNK